MMKLFWVVVVRSVVYPWSTMTVEVMNKVALVDWNARKSMFWIHITSCYIPLSCNSPSFSAVPVSWPFCGQGMHMLFPHLATRGYCRHPLQLQQHLWSVQLSIFIVTSSVWCCVCCVIVCVGERERLYIQLCAFQSMVLLAKITPQLHFSHFSAIFQEIWSKPTRSSELWSKKSGRGPAWSCWTKLFPLQAVSGHYIIITISQSSSLTGFEYVLLCINISVTYS